MCEGRRQRKRVLTCIVSVIQYRRISVGAVTMLGQAAIYSEPLAPTGKSFADFVAGNELNDAAWKPFEQPLVDRATKAVRIEHR